MGILGAIGKGLAGAAKGVAGGTGAVGATTGVLGKITSGVMASKASTPGADHDLSVRTPPFVPERSTASAVRPPGRRAPRRSMTTARTMSSGRR